MGLTIDLKEFEGAFLSRATLAGFSRASVDSTGEMRPLFLFRAKSLRARK